ARPAVDSTKPRWPLSNRRRRPWLCGIAFLLGACLICGLAVAGPAQESPLLEKALELERNPQFRDVCALYDSAPPKDRAPPGLVESYQRSLRHVLQDRRHRERAFREAIVSLKKAGQVLDVYEKVLQILRTHYVDPERTSFDRLFQQGLFEMRCALEDDVFRRNYLADAKPKTVVDLRKQLLGWDQKDVVDVRSAREQLRKVAKLAQDLLHLELPVVAFEFVCGACNSLDEYTAYLTPSQGSEMRALMRGKFAG